MISILKIAKKIVTKIAIDELYMELAQEPKKNLQKLKKMVDDKSRKEGYNIGEVYHGTGGEFYELDKNRPTDGGFHFTPDIETAQNYANNKIDGKVLKVYLRIDELDTGDGRRSYPSGKKVKWRGDKKISPLNWKSGFHYRIWQPEQAKFSDAVTYDDNKKIIPLSKRFNSKSKDMRY